MISPVAAVAQVRDDAVGEVPGEQEARLLGCSIDPFLGHHRDAGAGDVAADLVRAGDLADARDVLHVEAAVVDDGRRPCRRADPVDGPSASARAVGGGVRSAECWTGVEAVLDPLRHVEVAAALAGEHAERPAVGLGGRPGLDAEAVPCQQLLEAVGREVAQVLVVDEVPRPVDDRGEVAVLATSRPLGAKRNEMPRITSSMSSTWARTLQAVTMSAWPCWATIFFASFSLKNSWYFGP
jgi:hypothetical protein